MLAFALVIVNFGIRSETICLAETPAPESNQAATEKGDGINFSRDIEPIFAARCLKCHGPQKRSGGLRLDARMFAEAGGDSARPILGGTLETNELYRRVSATDRTVRMPKNNDPLPSDDIEMIKRWVEQDTPWSSAGLPAKTAGRPFYERWLNSVGDMADRYNYELTRAVPLAVAFLVIQVLLLAVARAKAAYLSGRRWTTGRIQWLCRFCSRVSSREMSVVWLLSIAGSAIWMILIHQQKLDGELEQLRTMRARVESPWVKTVFGSPPVPIRPDHLKQVAGTYYRGNCERNAALFNSGNYLTAIFRVGLCDASHKAVETGDPAPAGGVYLRLEIERAPGTTYDLFSKEMMAAVFLSKHFYEAGGEKRVDQPARLEIVDKDQKWVAYSHLGSPDDKGELHGLIYVFTGRIEDNTVRGDPHYGVKYDLSFADGKLTDQSDLWMSSFGNGAVVNPEPPGKIPYREWFDYRPLPVIEGENSKDPKLLGIEEYVKKGLIPPKETPKQEE